MRYGYALILPGGMPEDEARGLMEENGIPEEKRYFDRPGRVETKRDSLRTLLSEISPGDTIYTPGIRCLAAGLREAIETIEEAEGMRAGVEIGDLEESGLPPRAAIKMLRYAYENDLAMRKNQQRQGIEDAHSRKAAYGRPRNPRPRNFAVCMKAFENNEISGREAQRRMGVSNTTFYRWLRDYRSEMQIG